MGTNAFTPRKTGEEASEGQRKVGPLSFPHADAKLGFCLKAPSPTSFGDHDLCQHMSSPRLRYTFQGPRVNFKKVVPINHIGWRLLRIGIGSRDDKGNITPWL